jgi:hypothetical protein
VAQEQQKSARRGKMVRRLSTYIAAFFGGFITWACFSAIEAMNPLLPWKYPPVAIFTGISFPGGAPPSMHYLNHVAETWFPFLVAFAIARAMTRKRARFLGALFLYMIFLFWSLGMAWLVGQEVPIRTIFNIGLIGTLIGGAGLYLWLVDPIKPLERTP